MAAAAPVPERTFLPSLPDSTSPIASPHTINIGTRKSNLALVQTNIVVNQLQKSWPQHKYVVKAISTMGDKNQVSALHNFGDKGLWTHELEAMLLEGQVDFIVHSLKDIPTHLPPSCTLAAILQREDARDALVLHPKYFPPHPSAPPQIPTLSSLPQGSIIGTSSVRRSAQLKRLYPQLEFESIRGNVETRLRKLDDENSQYVGIVLAAAGLKRVNLGHRISGYLESRNVEGDAAASHVGHAHQPMPEQAEEGGKDDGAGAQDVEERQRRKGDRRWGMLHAVGQGALGIEAREGDERTAELLKPLICEHTSLACLAERSLMRTLEGGCSVPIGVETEWVKKGSNGSSSNGTASHDGETMRSGLDATPASDPSTAIDPDSHDLTMRAIVVSLDGKEAAEAEVTKAVANEADADDFGREVALLLSQRGAEKILASINLNRDVIENQAGGA